MIDELITAFVHGALLMSPVLVLAWLTWEGGRR